jgi:hypothetical protein
MWTGLICWEQGPVAGCLERGNELTFDQVTSALWSSLISLSLLVHYLWPVMFWNILLVCWGTPTHYLNRQHRRKENVVQLLLIPTLDEFLMFMKPAVLLQESSAPVNPALCHSNPVHTFITCCYEENIFMASSHLLLCLASIFYLILQ